jgi:hypothetical protein
MVEVFGLIEPFKLVVDSLCLRDVRLDWQVLFILKCNEIFELLLHLKLCQSLLKSLRLVFNELGQIVGKLLVSIKVEGLFR